MRTLKFDDTGDRRVEPGFRRGTGAEEICIDCFQITVWVDDRQAQEAQQNDPRI